MNPKVIAVIILMIMVGGGLAYYFLVYKKKDGPSVAAPATTASPAATAPSAEPMPMPMPTPMPTPKSTPPAATPLETLLKSGQDLQVEELEISKTPIPFTKSPTGYIDINVRYSMSLDINVLKELPGSWYCILSNNNKQDWPIDASVRRPVVFLTGKEVTDVGPRKVHIVHSTGTNANEGIITEFTATIGTYFNLTFVVDKGTLITYINGIPDKKGKRSGAFNWSLTKDAWTWNHCKTDLSIKVKNVYWFNKALTADEVTLIGTKQTSGTSKYVPPPGNYEPEPYSLDF